jgi:hypothetical protein
MSGETEEIDEAPEETAVRRTDPLAVSLDLELLTLANATRGAEILADYQTRQGFLDDPAEEDAPVGVFSILSLVGGRLEQLRRVIRGEEDPARICASHNSVALPETLADLDGDIVLFPWKARGGPLVIARHRGVGPEPEDKARKVADLNRVTESEPKGTRSKGRKVSKGAKETGRGSVPKSPGVQPGEPKESPPSSPAPT